MRKVHEKSIVLGIGIGMIITAIAGMIFSAGTSKELSKEEIMNKAKIYGMREQVQFLNNTSIDSINVAAESTAANSTVANSTAAENTTATNSTINSTVSESTIATNSTINSTVSESTIATNSTINSTVSESTTAINTTTGSTASDSNASDSTIANNTAIKSTSTDVSERNIRIRIKSGLRVQGLIDILLKKEVILSEVDFKTVLNSYKGSTKIKAGTYMFKKNDDLNYIVKTICKLK
jgi:gas vesicle protein